MTDVLGFLLKLLYAWALPSALFVGAIWFFLLPQLDSLHFLRCWLEEATRDKETQVFILITVVLAIFLSSVSTLLYRLLEGVIWPRCLRWLWERWRKRELARKQELQALAKGTGWQRDDALEELARYPHDDDDLLPTRFGNAIRAFETYGSTRFNLDSVTLFHELLAVAPKYLPAQIDLYRSYVDFWVASCYLSGIFSFVCLALGAVEHFKVCILLLGAVALVLAFLCHWLARLAIDDWSYPVVALVNLGRAKLADSLGLKLPETLEKERDMWRCVALYAYDADPGAGKELDAYRKAPTEQPVAEQADGEAGNGGAGANDETP